MRLLSIISLALLVLALEAQKYRPKHGKRTKVKHGRNFKGWRNTSWTKRRPVKRHNTISTSSVLNSKTSESAPPQQPFQQGFCPAGCSQQLTDLTNAQKEDTLKLTNNLESINQLKTEMDQLKNTIQDLAKSKEESELAMTALKEEVTNLKATCDGNTNSITTIQSTLESLGNRITNNEMEIAKPFLMANPD